jgi:hypothetical protein
VNEQDRLETLGFLAILVPFWAIIVSAPILLIAASCRYLLFRHRDAEVIDLSTPTI